MTIPTIDYEKITAEDRPGSSGTASRAAKMRSFVLPQEFVATGSDLNDVFKRGLARRKKGGIDDDMTTDEECKHLDYCLSLC